MVAFLPIKISSFPCIAIKLPIQSQAVTCDTSLFSPLDLR